MTNGALPDITAGDARVRPASWPVAALVLALAVAAIVTVWLFQAAGFAPCELCLKERIPYYIAIAVAAGTLVATRTHRRLVVRTGFAALMLLFLFSAGLAIYHAGVEWDWWAGPSDCSGPLGDHAASSADFLRQLQTVRVVRCDAVAIRIVGLSLAGWNAVASFALVVLSIAGFRRS